jgi:hypothetical protein
MGNLNGNGEPERAMKRWKERQLRPTPPVSEEVRRWAEEERMRAEIYWQEREAIDRMNREKSG